MDRNRFLEVMEMLSLAYDDFAVTAKKTALWHRIICGIYTADVAYKAAEHWILHNKKPPVISDMIDECYEVVRDNPQLKKT